MAFESHLAPRRVTKLYAFFTRITQACRKAALHKRGPVIPDLKHLPPHMARDIGLTDGDMARHQHQWPSETNVHPRM